MRLIDAEEYEQSLIANGWDESDDEFSAGGIFEILYEAQTVQAIPLDKVKEARDEIDDLDRYFDNDYFSSNSDAMFKCSDVFSILDKLIESEEK